MVTGLNPNPNPDRDPNRNPNHCPPHVAMFGVQHGEGAVQFARSDPELMCHEQRDALTQPNFGTRFLSLAFVKIYMQNWSKMQHKSCSHFCSTLREGLYMGGGVYDMCMSLRAHCERGTLGMVREGQLQGGVEGGSPPLLGLFFGARQYTHAKLF